MHSASLFAILIFPVLCLSLLKVQTYDLEEALAKEMIVISDISYLGDKTLKVRMKNESKKKDVKVHVPSGTQFASLDSTEQDQVILKGRTILVRAGSTGGARFTSYCTQADHLSPGQGSTFALKPRAEGRLLDLAHFLGGMRDVDYTAQQAVWVITNDHDLRGLHHEDPAKALRIQEFMQELTGKEAPAYTVRYRESRERQVAFTRESITIHAVHEYDLEKDGLFTCRIYNEAGEVVQEVFVDQPQRKGHIRFSFRLQTRVLPAGKYVSRVFRDGELFRELWMES